VESKFCEAQLYEVLSGQPKENTIKTRNKERELTQLIWVYKF
jgi:hypothetical protein